MIIFTTLVEHWVYRLVDIPLKADKRARMFLFHDGNTTTENKGVAVEYQHFVWDSKAP